MQDESSWCISLGWPYCCDTLPTLMQQHCLMGSKVFLVCRQLLLQFRDMWPPMPWDWAQESWCQGMSALPCLPLLQGSSPSTSYPGDQPCGFRNWVNEICLALGSCVSDICNVKSRTVFYRAGSESGSFLQFSQWYGDLKAKWILIFLHLISCCD